MLKDKLKMTFSLENGARVMVIVHKPYEGIQETTQQYKYFVQMKKDPTKRDGIILTNEIKLNVSYTNGIVLKCDLSMHLVFPERLGKKEILGVDVSPNSKKFFVFYYEKEIISVPDGQQDKAQFVYSDGNQNVFKISKVQIGITSYDLKDISPVQLVEELEFPFPVLTQIPESFCHSGYGIPFIDNNGNVQHFQFPDSIIA